MLTLTLLALTATLSPPQSQMLPTGKLIDPVGSHQSVGQYPVNMVKVPGTDIAVVTTVGFQQYLSTVKISTGKVLDQVDYKHRRDNPDQDGLYYGLAVHPKTKEVFAARGAQDKVTAYSISPTGKLTETRTIEDKAPEERLIPYHFAGVAFNSNGSRLLVVKNQTAFTTGQKGLVTVYQTDTGDELFTLPTSGFPLAAAYITKGPHADRKAYVASERDACLDVIDVRNKVNKGTIRVGEAPVGLHLNRDHSKLFVANSASDTVSIVNTHTDKVIDTISLRPNHLRGIPGAGPQGLELSPDEKTLYVTLSDMNAVAVVDLDKAELEGYVPTGWLPTAVVHQNGHFLVTSAKGTQTKNPNPIPDGENRGAYIMDLIDGTVSHFRTTVIRNLERHTDKVIANNRLRPNLDTAKPAGFFNPGIKHVIYIIKENRTYDNVLGDLPRGNGDPSQTLFPREVTPNQHALAERFGIFDNFYVCAEVSQDGWVWSTAGMVNAYASRNTPYNYGRRGRNYDTEGQNNGVATDLLGIPDVTRPPSGYIWEHSSNHGVSFRNYGMFLITSADELEGVPGTTDNYPSSRALEGMSSPDFRRYDLTYADSEIYEEYDWNWTDQTQTYGSHNAPSRFSAWKREFDEFVAKGEMPKFQMIRFGQDHTSGTRVGQPTPQSMVADNDFAVGQLVEAVSNSPFWESTAICILEDDAQAGYDHVDAHRSIAFVISPYNKRNNLDSTFYNTDSMLRTMCLLLGMPPMSQYDAVATPFKCFSRQMVNTAPFKAIKPSRDIVCQENGLNAYRAEDCEDMNNDVEESDMDEELNDILWGAIKGPDVPRPFVRRGLRLGYTDDDD